MVLACLFVCVVGWYPCPDDVFVSVVCWSPCPDVVFTPLPGTNIFSTITINRLCVLCAIILRTGGDAFSGVLGSEI